MSRKDFNKESDRFIHELVLLFFAAVSAMLDPKGTFLSLKKSIPLTLGVILNLLAIAAYSYGHEEHALFFLGQAIFCLLLQIVERHER